MARAPALGAGGRTFESCHSDSPMANRAGEQRKWRGDRPSYLAPSTFSASPAVYSLLSTLFFGPPVAFAFEKLLVYQKSIDFADSVCQRTEQFPRGYGFLVDQLNRAALSIAANIAEGNGRFTKPDRRNFFGISRGSIQECVPLLELALRRKLLDETSHSELKDRLEEIARMLSGLIKGLENREA